MVFFVKNAPLEARAQVVNLCSSHRQGRIPKLGYPDGPHRQEVEIKSVDFLATCK